MRRRTEERATAVVVILAIIGCALIATSIATAVRTFEHGQYGCGSVIFPKDPRNLVSKRAAVPPALIGAHDQCESLRATQSTRASGLLIGGGALLVFALAAPSLARRARRMRRRLRSRR